MREMKNRLLSIEAQLQTLYRETGDESEVSNSLNYSLLRSRETARLRHFDRSS